MENELIQIKNLQKVLSYCLGFTLAVSKQEIDRDTMLDILIPFTLTVIKVAEEFNSDENVREEIKNYLKNFGYNPCAEMYKEVNEIYLKEKENDIC